MAILGPGASRVHPVRGVLVVRGITLRQAARELGMNPTVLGRQLNGNAPATQRVRRGLSKLLGRPQAELFLEDEP